VRQDHHDGAATPPAHPAPEPPTSVSPPATCSPAAARSSSNTTASATASHHPPNKRSCRSSQRCLRAFCPWDDRRVRFPFMRRRSRLRLLARLASCISPVPTTPAPSPPRFMPCARSASGRRHVCQLCPDARREAHRRKPPSARPAHVAHVRRSAHRRYGFSEAVDRVQQRLLPFRPKSVLSGSCNLRRQLAVGGVEHRGPTRRKSLDYFDNGKLGRLVTVVSIVCATFVRLIFAAPSLVLSQSN